MDKTPYTEIPIYDDLEISQTPVADGVKITATMRSTGRFTRVPTHEVIAAIIQRLKRP